MSCRRCVVIAGVADGRGPTLRQHDENRLSYVIRESVISIGRDFRIATRTEIEILR